MNNERRTKISKIVEELKTLQGEVDDLHDAEQEAFDNLSESLQTSEQGEKMEAAAMALEECDGMFDDLIDKLEEAINA